MEEQYMCKGFVFESGKAVKIRCVKGESEAVMRAAKNLRCDIEGIFGCKAEIVQISVADIQHVLKGSNSEADIIISTKEVYACIEDESALGKWEGYAICEKCGSLFICGADKRGTIFGIYELSKRIGVSPWYYFADVPYKKKDRYVIPDGFKTVDYPSVQYRGIFLNDEEELENWAIKHTSDRTIGPFLYSKIYELLLRLKGNYIWPAMHVNYFQENPENARLANEMGIVVGTSHCDMLMRSNQNEWNPWLKSRGFRSDYDAVHSDRIDEGQKENNKEIIYYDYSVPGHNQEVIKEYWRESVSMNSDYEVCYTVGMRGVHDYGFVTSEIDNDDSLSEAQKDVKRIKLLEHIIGVQREMVGKDCLQSFIPYKEVLELYNKGLVVPDDVTLIWVDDNFGYMRRYPNKKELQRSGGHGLYYHVSYWGAPDMNYLFINSIPLAQIFNELKKSYISGIKKMWVLNVGALKPLEMEIEAFIQYGWDADKGNAAVVDVHKYTVSWFNSIFSGSYGEQLAVLYERFAQLTNARKIEHMTSHVFSQYGYGDEAGERVCELWNIFRESNEIYYQIPENEREAFFQLFLFKIHASYYFNCSYYYADRSFIMDKRKNNRAADYYTLCSVKVMKYMKKMLYYYNKGMCLGKWDGILTPESFPPPGINFYPVCRPSVKRQEAGMTVALWDGRIAEDGCRLEFCSEGVCRKWIELGNQGIRQFHFRIKCDANWLSIEDKEGIVDTERRIYITALNMEDSNVCETTLRIENTDSGQNVCIRVATGSINTGSSDGAICIYADGYNKKCDDKYGEGWEVSDYLGLGYGNAVTAFNKYSTIGKAYLEYNFQLDKAGSFELVIVRYLTLNSIGSIRLMLSIDDRESIMIDSDTVDEWTGKWKESVLNNGERLRVRLPYLYAGEHVLRVYMVDNFVTISKMVIYTDKRRDTFFEYSVNRCKSDFPEIDWCMTERIQKEIYNVCEEDIFDVVYADKDFWNYNRIYMKNKSIIQSEYGIRKYSDYYDLQTGNAVADYFGHGIFAEYKGIIAIEAEYAIEASEYAFLSSNMNGNNWEPVHAPSDGGSGLAMLSPCSGHTWDTDITAPGMHFRVSISDGGVFKVWLLVYYENNTADTCFIAVDGVLQTEKAQYCKGEMFNYSTMHIYYWCLLSEAAISSGEHIISVFAGDGGLQIDRIYLTKGEELPPNDSLWKVSR